MNARLPADTDGGEWNTADQEVGCGSEGGFSEKGVAEPPWLHCPRFQWLLLAMSEFHNCVQRFELNREQLHANLAHFPAE